MHENPDNCLRVGLPACRHRAIIGGCSHGLSRPRRLELDDTFSVRAKAATARRRRRLEQGILTRAREEARSRSQEHLRIAVEACTGRVLG